MTIALVKNGSEIMQVTDADTFAPGLYDNGGLNVGSPFGLATGLSSEIYGVIPATYADTAPTATAYSTGPNLTASTVDTTMSPPVARIVRNWADRTRDDYLNQVNAERDRRIALGLTVQVSPGKSVPVDTRGDTDIRNIQGLATIAFARIANSDATLMAFRGRDNATYMLTPQEMWALANGDGVAGHIAYLYAKAWTLKDNSEMVADVTADQYWS